MIADALPRLLSWSVRRIGAHTLVGLGLLALLLGSAAAGLDYLAHGMIGRWLVVNTLLALLLGWALARTSLPGWLAGSLAAFCGIIAVATSVARMGWLLLLLLETSLEYAAAVLTWRSGQPLADPTRLILLFQDVSQRTGDLAGKGVSWIAGILHGASGYDAQAAALAWNLLLWGAAVWAAWAMRRREQPLAASLPVLALFAAGLAYSRGQVILLVPALGAALALLAWNQYGQRSRAWRRSGTDYAEDIAFDASVWSGILALGIVLLAWWISTFSPQQALRFARDLIQPRSPAVDELGRALGLPEGAAATSARVAGYMPRRHLVGAGPELGKQVVFLARLVGASPGPAERNFPIYWKLATYDIYTGAGWMGGVVEEADYKAGQPISRTPPLAARWLDQEMQFIDPTATGIVYIGELERVDRSYQVSWRPTGEVPDAFSARLQRPPRNGKYQARTFTAAASEEQLRAADQALPAELAGRYLHLPTSTPQRVHDLARDITARAANPYDRARAIETYLRRIPYTLDVPAPPTDRDAVDYFLFDLQRGYCDYYATAMVVLARAAGLPARLVIGYAQGSYDPAADQYILTEADAHSWVEIYFPQYGWITFEPTGGRPPLERLPYPEAAEASNVAPPPPAAMPVIEWPVPGWEIWLFAIALLSVLAWFAWGKLDAWWLRRQAGAVQLSVLYRRLRRQGQRLGVAASPGETPYEFTGALTQRLEYRLTGQSRWQDFWRARLAPAGREARRLVELYARAIYSQHPPEAAARTESLGTWKKLRWRLWLAGLQRARK